MQGIMFVIQLLVCLKKINLIKSTNKSDDLKELTEEKLEKLQ